MLPTLGVQLLVGLNYPNIILYRNKPHGIRYYLYLTYV